MIRFAWLQSRTQTAVAGALLLAVAVVAIITGIQLSHLYDSNVASCHSSCGLVIQNYLSHDNFLDQSLGLLAHLVPALFGVFWGAPLLAREFETGTYRLAWTQSVSRRRWLLSRIALGAVATVALAGLFSLTVTWWNDQRDTVSTTVYSVFDRRDIAPIGYALFAFAAGVMFGALIRRTVAAMAATLGLFGFARVAVALWIRPHLLSAQHAVVSLARSGKVLLGIGRSNGGSVHVFAQGGGPSNSWVQARHFVTPSGHPVSSAQLSAFLHQQCAALYAQTGPPPGGPGPVPANDPAAVCLDRVSSHFALAVTYQPASRYWIFQWLEVGIFAALALVAIAVTYWWLIGRARTR